MTLVSASKRFLSAAALLLVVGLTAACANVPVDPNWAHLALAPDGILLAFQDRVVLIDPVDGSPVELRDAEGNTRLDDAGNPRVWEIRPPDNQQTRFYNTPVFLNEATLLIPSYDRRIFEVDYAGARINNATGFTVPNHIIGDVAAGDTTIFVPYGEEDMAAFSTDALSGDPLWRLDTTKGIWSRPLVVEGTVYAAAMDHNLYAVDAATGELLWRLDMQGAMASTPAYQDGFIYVGSFARKLFMVSTSGEIIAECPTRDWVWGTPVIADGVVYAGDVSGYAYAFAMEAGECNTLWERQVATRALRATPVVTEDAVILGSRDRFVYWVSRETGEELLRREMRGEVLADLMWIEPNESFNLSEPMVIVSTMAREELLVAFAVDNGERRWAYGR